MSTEFLKIVVHKEWEGGESSRETRIFVYDSPRFTLVPINSIIQIQEIHDLKDLFVVTSDHTKYHAELPIEFLKNEGMIRHDKPEDELKDGQLVLEAERLSKGLEDKNA